MGDKDEIKQEHAVDLKEATVSCVAAETGARERFAADLRSAGACRCPLLGGAGAPDSGLDLEVTDGDRAFEVIQSSKSPLLQKLAKELPWSKRTRLVLVAETADLCAKWVSLIESGPY